jgi:ferredoxin
MRSVLALLMMLWLPLQGFAAMAMPICPHALGHAAASAPANHAHMHHSHAGHHESRAPASDQQTDSNCVKCGACHLACTPAAPAWLMTLRIEAGQRYQLDVPATPALFIPDQPHPPPAVA